MELGEKLRQARLDAGLSQRQLCGSDITRNMLSLIENGTARPSMKTLTLLAERLGKPLSYFLDDQSRDFSNLQVSAGNLHQARLAMDAGKTRYAQQLLESVTAPELLREKLLLFAKIPGTELSELCRQLPSLDEELLLRAQAALDAGDFPRCRILLSAAEDHASSHWNLIRGKLELACGNWAQASGFLLRAELAYPEAMPLLETCFRELGDYKQAYEYACKQKK